jgi:tyrosine-protein phosphatase SIW14
MCVWKRKGKKCGVRVCFHTHFLSYLNMYGPLVPPLNFALVESGIYRSGHPNPKNYKFLKKLGLKTILFMSKEDYPKEMLSWLEENQITFYQYRTAGNKEPFTEMDPKQIAQILGMMLDTRNHPILVHCNKGKHRVGCLVGCLRKLQVSYFIRKYIFT